MNILFDINHPVDVNLFKNAINVIDQNDHKIILTYRPRGKLKKIIEYELKKYSPIRIGKHYRSFFKKIFGQLYRDFKMITFQKQHNIDLSVCFGPTNAIASCLNKIPYLDFEDDFEYKIPFYHANIFSTRHIMPAYIKVNKKNIYHYSGFKELAYLHPRYYKPNIKKLIEYDLKPDEYVFIREVSNVSLNYKKTNNHIFQIVDRIKTKNIKILISLEDDSLRAKLSSDCIILKEPVDDIYSLMKYSRFTISAGDTMARESCLLGTPCIYTGGRDMAMNDALINMRCLFKDDDIGTILKRIDYLSDGNIKQRVEKEINQQIENEWQDTTEIILKHISDFEN